MSKSKLALIITTTALVAFGIGNISDDVIAAGNLQSKGKLIYSNPETNEEIVIDTEDHELLKTDINTNTKAIENNADRISSLEQSFQDGCDTIVAGCTTYGSTPASNSPSDIVKAIKEIHDNRYSEGETSLNFSGRVFNQFGNTSTSTFTFKAVKDCRYTATGNGSSSGGVSSCVIAGKTFGGTWNVPWSMSTSGTLKTGETIVVNATAGGASGQYAYANYNISINP